MKSLLWVFPLSFFASLFAQVLPVETPPAVSQSEAERVLSSDQDGAILFNRSLADLRMQLKERFEKAACLMQEGGAQESEYAELLGDIRNLRAQIRSLEERWKDVSVEEAARSDEAYALWDVGEITLAQLIMEYGSGETLYVVPPELGGMKLTLFSGIPLPRESWSEMVEMILSQNGVGIKKLNPFVKQLYILKLDPSGIEAVIGREEDLQLFSNHARVCYVFSPPAEQVKTVQSFFERFSDPKQTTIQSVGSKVLVVSTKETVEKLLGLHRAVWDQNRGKVVRIANLSRISPPEAEKILKAVFADQGNKNRPAYYASFSDELVSFALPQGLVLVGENDLVERGQKILTDLEGQLEDPSEKIIYWYGCKHSNPEDIAAVLEKVYDSLLGSAFEKKGETAVPVSCPATPAQDAPLPANSGNPAPPSAPGNPVNPSSPGPFPYIAPGSTFNPVLTATAPFVQASLLDKNQKSAFGSFIVDTKTTSILMVVRREELPKIKALLRKLDVPKKMVQLDVLLVEKRLTDRKQAGFNLLQIGTNASGKKETAFSYDVREKAGLASFIFSKNKGDFPAVDMIFNFLMAQEDIRINANPSVLAINQTPAQISVVEEISINNGAFPINTPTGVVVENSFTRAQYGITINLTPTIQMPDPEEEEGLGFVSLETNLQFDTTQTISLDSRPNVARRHIENQVRVADGETVILGGLRKKIEEDRREKIPFLCDLPGLGKLFTTVRASETNTELFVFITPHIIRDPIDDLRRIRQCEYQKRAGDIPEFLARIDEAKEEERSRLFRNSLKTLFDLN